MQLQDNEQRAFYFKNEPNPDRIWSWNPLTILERLLHKWPPCDARVLDQYTDSHCVYSTDSAWIKHIFQEIELKIIDKIPTENTIIVGVYFPANIAKIERYFQKYNEEVEQWRQNDSPEDITDPLSGDIYEIPAPVPPTPPRHNKGLYLRLKISLEIQSEIFIMSFSIEDTKKRILYYNVLKNNNINYLMKRMMHELFGNPFITGNKGAFLEGIIYLIQGKKTKLCLDHQKPFWITNTDQIRTNNPELLNNTISIKLIQSFIFILKYFIPIILAYYGVLKNTWDSLILFSESGNGDPFFSLKIISTIILIVCCLSLSRKLEKQIIVLKLKSKFL